VRGVHTHAASIRINALGSTTIPLECAACHVEMARGFAFQKRVQTAHSEPQLTVAHVRTIRCRVTLAAAVVGAVGAVTDTTRVPTADSNYMVMQGDIGYTSTGTDPLPPPPHQISPTVLLS
jgi:hypothetical protein